MKKLFLALLLFPLLATAKPPVEEDILDRTLDTSSPFYYTKLMMRYNTGDETLSAEDYHYLYYGYAYQDAYKPLNSNPDMDRLMMAASRVDFEKPRVDEVESLLSIANDAYARDPFSPTVLNLMAYSYGALGDTIREKAYFDRMNGVLGAIRDSGDALTQKSPRHVLMFDHALDLLAADDIAHGKARVISRTVEFVPLLSPRIIDDKKVKGYYFDFGRVYWNKPEGYTYKRDRTWQFNNLKPRVYK